MTNYFEDHFSKYQCGFRKGFSVANCLLPMIEKWRESLDQGGAYGALLKDLSKAFDCLPHDHLIAKLHGYGLDIKSLKLMFSYLTNRNSVWSFTRFYLWPFIIQHFYMQSLSFYTKF